MRLHIATALAAIIAGIVLLSAADKGRATMERHDASRAVKRLDAQVIKANPQLTGAIAKSIGRPDKAGLIGRNRQWKRLHSVRFQYGAGRALRHGLATGDQQVVHLAGLALNAGLKAIQADGSFPISVPKSLADTVRPGRGDQASAAAFFLSDICPALIIARPGDKHKAVVSKAMKWLAGQNDLLIRHDRHAANRLLINALAFYACGVLADDMAMIRRADAFIAMALKFVRDDGVFVEAGGSDTSYQAVSLVAAQDLLAFGYDGVHKEELEQSWHKGIMWLAERIGADGRLDSADNTRTCGQEAFLGRRKEVDLREVFRALAYAQVYDDRPIKRFAAFTKWLKTRPNPCKL